MSRAASAEARTGRVTVLRLRHERRLTAVWSAVCALFCGFIVFFPLTDSDIWWHLAAAREMLGRRAFLATDPFAFTSVNARWIDLHWLFQIAAWVVYGAGGVAGLVWGKVVIFAGACAVLPFAMPGKRNGWVWTVALCLLMYEARYLVLVRPVVVTLLYIAAYLYCLERARLGELRYLWALPFVQVLWVNTQGLFALGLFVVGAYAAASCAETALAAIRKRRRIDRRVPLCMAAAFALSLAACFVNPYGIDGVLLPLELLRRIDPAASNIYATNVSENLPLMLLLRSEPRYVYAVAAAAAAAAFSFVLNRRSQSMAHVILFGGFLCLAIMAHRNVLLFMFVAAALIGHNLSNAPVVEWMRQGRRGWRGRLRTAGAVLVCLMIAGRALTHAAVLRVCPRGGLVSPFRFPEGAVRYLEQHPLSGNIFNSVRHGGYLLWETYPPKQVYVDGRLIIRSRDFYARYLGILDNPERFDGVRERYGITHVLLPTAVFERYVALARHLYGDGRWRLVHTDGANVLYVIDTCAATPAIDLGAPDDVGRIIEGLQIRWRRDPYIYRDACCHLVGLLRAMGASQHEGLVLRAMRAGPAVDTPGELPAEPRAPFLSRQYRMRRARTVFVREGPGSPYHTCAYHFNQREDACEYRS